MTGPSSGTTYPERLRDLALSKPDRPVITVWSQDGEEVTTAAELWSDTVVYAARLRANGVGRECLVMVATRNCAAFYATAHAAWTLGATVLPYDPTQPAAALDRVEQTAAQRWSKVVRLDLDHTSTHAPLHVDLQDFEVPQPGWAFLSGGSSGAPKLIVNDGDHLGVPTTGPLPGVPGMVGMQTHQVQLVAGPLFHGAPASWSTLGLFHGHTLVVMERFDAEAAVDLIERHGVQWAFLVPTMMRRILAVQDLRPDRLRSIEAVCHASAPCPPAVKRQWLDLVGPERVYEGFGGTEAAGASVIRGDAWLEHLGSVGRPVPGWDAAVLDDAGNHVAPGEVGLIHFRPNDGHVHFAYVGADRKVGPDGWVTLGDMGRMDTQGYLYVADRRSDLIITGGANVYPAEVEAALHEHPHIADAVVVGAPDPDLGHRVVAIVEVLGPVAAPTPDELIAHCRERLARYKVPREVRIVESLPRNPQGKLQRRKLWDAPPAQATEELR